MAGFNFSSHGSQDLYPTMLTKQYHYGKDKSTVVNVCANLGALAGGIVIAHLSTFIGRRTAILIGNVIAGIMIYFWAFHPMWITAFSCNLVFKVLGQWCQFIYQNCLLHISVHLSVVSCTNWVI